MPRVWRVGLVLLAAALGWSAGGRGCSRPAAPTGTAPVRVVVTIAPLAGLVRALLPEGAELTVLMPPGRSEHGYELTAQDAGALAGADLVVYVAPGLEARVAEYLEKRPVAGRRELGVAAAIGIANVADHDEDEHDGAGGAEHSEHGADAGQDPHLWLDPGLVEKMVPKMRGAVEQALAARAGFDAAARGRLDAAEAKLLADVRALDEEYRRRLGPLKGAALVTHHAAWKRLADRYGLRIAAVIRPIEGGEPTMEAVRGAVEAVKKEGARVIFVEPQFSPVAAEHIARLAGVRTAVLDPLGDGDWFKMMRGNLDSLAENLGR